MDALAAETCAYMNLIHPHYSLLAARISVNNLHKMTKESFADTVKDLYEYKVLKYIIYFLRIKLDVQLL